MDKLYAGVVTFCWTPVVLVLRLCHEPELVSSAGDAGAVLELDAFVPVPDHVLVQSPDELVHGHAREVPFVEELLLEPAEEPLRGRVVGAAALRAHGTRQPVLLADADPSGPPVVAASIAVDDRTLAVPERGARLAQHPVGQLGVRPGADRPGHRHPVMAVDHRRQVRLARGDAELGDVRDPQAVRRLGVEVPVHEVRGRLAADLAPVRAVAARPFERGDQPVPGHQPHDPLRGHDDPRAPQLEPHPPVPVAAAAVLERLPHQGEQPLVAVRPGHRAQLVEVRAALFLVKLVFRFSSGIFFGFGRGCAGRVCFIGFGVCRT